MMDPASYLLISSCDTSLIGGPSISNSMGHSLSDFEQSTSDASSSSPSQYGDPFVGGLCYFDQPSSELTPTTTTTTPEAAPHSRAPTLSSPVTADLVAAATLNQQHQHQQGGNHHHHHNHHHNLHHHNHHHHHSHHHSHNQLPQQHHHHNGVHHLAGSPSPLMLNINNFSLDQLVDHSVADMEADLIDQSSVSLPYLDHVVHHNHNHHLHHHHHHQQQQHHHHHHLDPHTSMVDPSQALATMAGGGVGCGIELGGDDDDDDHDLIHGTLTSFVCTDLGSESDNGYTSAGGVSDGLFTSSSSLVDCSSDSLGASEAYCFKQFSFSDLHGLIDVGQATPKQLTGSTEKRSVLMNLLIYGSDIGAGYTSIKR